MDAAPAPRRFEIPVVLKIMLSAGFALFVLARILMLAEMTQEISDGGPGEGTPGTFIAAIWLGEGATMLLSGGLVLGGAWGGRLPGWAQVALSATGVFVAVTAGGIPGGVPVWWYGLA